MLKLECVSGRNVIIPRLINKHKLTGKGVEVGVWEGWYSSLLLRRTSLSVLYSVDPWAAWIGPKGSQAINDERYEKTIWRLGKFKERSVIIRKTSQEASKMFEERSLDFVYIDASHGYESISNDIKLWWPKIKAQGILSGHDYMDVDDYGVIRAVDEHCESENIKPRITRDVDNYPSWIIIK